MKVLLVSVLITCSINAYAGFFEYFEKHDWSDWETKENVTAYGSEWEFRERVQGSIHPSWHISRWIPSHGLEGYSGTEKRLINKTLGFDENILDLIRFPQKDGSYKPLLKKPFLNRYGRIDYRGSVGVYERDGVLTAYVEPDTEVGTDRLLPPYTDCGFLTAKQKIAYVTDRRHEPEVYRGEFDPKTQKFYMRHVSAPIQYVYYAEWEAMQPSIRTSDLKPGVDRADFVVGLSYSSDLKVEYKNKRLYLAQKEEKVNIPLICTPHDFELAKQAYQNYLNTTWKKQIDKEVSVLTEHEKATLVREDCDGIGLNYSFGCQQIDNYGYNDGNKNVFPKGTKPPRVVDNPDEF